MLTIQQSTTPHRGGVSRRDFLQIGGLGALGLTLPAMLHAETHRPRGTDSSFGRAKRCIIVFLFGGPSQLDLWDMKPDAPAEVRGPLKPIATNVPGIHVSELLPLTSRIADKYKIVRSVAHYHSEHSAGLHTMATGTYYRRPSSSPQRASALDHPHLGAIHAKWRGWRNNVPPFVQLPKIIGPPNYEPWPGQNGGFLGKKYAPVLAQGDMKKALFKLPAIRLPADVSMSRVKGRRELLEQLNGTLRAVEASGKIDEMSTLYQQAYSLISSKGVREAVDLTREPDKIRDRYGRHLYGQGMLTARRLCEAGVPLVCLYWIDPVPAGAGGGEFDSHGRLHHHYPKRLVPPTDRGLHGLLTDLSERGMLEDTLVVVMGEFGRTPRINKQAGRDHWPHCQSVLLAGAGISGGSVYGKSDSHAAYPIADRVASPDLAQTILHLLGVPPDFVLHDQLGRPIPACRGKRITALCT